MDLSGVENSINDIARIDQKANTTNMSIFKMLMGRRQSYRAFKLQKEAYGSDSLKTYKSFLNNERRFRRLYRTMNHRPYGSHSKYY